MKPTIVVADSGEADRKMFIEALAGTPYEVVGEAPHGDAMLESVELLKPWCVAVDLKIPGHANKPGDGGNLAVRRLSDKYPKVKVLIMHNADTVHLVMGAVSASHGVRVRKPIKREHLLDALTKLASGQEGELGMRQVGTKIKKAFIVHYKLASDGFFTKKRDALTTEVSEAGMQLVVTEKIARGTVMHVEMELAGEAPLKPKCQVANVVQEGVADRWFADLNFVELPPAERDRFKAFLRRLMERGTGIIPGQK